MSATSRREWLILSAIVGLALGVRVYALDRVPVTYDEAFSWRLAQFPFGQLIRQIPADAHPPLYYLALKSWITVWGDSIVALRALSVALGVLAVPLIYVLCREAGSAIRPRTGDGLHLGSLLSAFLLAFHGWQVSYSRNVRMYSIGVFLAGLSAWLLLRAIRTNNRKLVWWSAYGCSIALFAYTHYFALFIILAQAMFALGFLVNEWRRVGTSHPPSLFWHGIFAFVLFLILWLPWVQVFARQAREVQQEFWIPAVTVHGVQEVTFSWSTGLQPRAGYWSVFWLFMLAVCLVWSTLRVGFNTVFFLVLAAIPWVSAVCVFSVTGRSLVHERYLAFSGFFLIAYWGALVDQLRGRAIRLVLCFTLVSVTVAGTWETAMFVRDSNQRAVYKEAINWLRSHYQPGDMMVTNSPADLCLLRFYAEHCGLPELDVRTSYSESFGSGHVLHAAALTTEDVFVPPTQTTVTTPKRIWFFDNALDAVNKVPKSFKVERVRDFHDADGEPITLLLLERDASADEK